MVAPPGERPIDECRGDEPPSRRVETRVRQCELSKAERAAEPEPLALEIRLYDGVAKGNIAGLLGTVRPSDNRVDKCAAGGETRGPLHRSSTGGEHDGNGHGQ